MRDGKVELTAPAGSFMSAYYAFEAGAGAVYLGLRDFSARKTAQNFNDQELSKIKRIAVARKKKLYVAVNTVIKENEIEDLVSALAFCRRLEVDGIIIQDFGVIDLVRNYFPGIPIHASTQMAISNSEGVAVACELGIKRVILPRELSFAQVLKLRRKFPAMEFEVFIHGALCYSYSGLCLASGLLAGRSGNRGECAQVCRLEFTHEGKPGHYLSCRDLFSGRNVLRLIDAGIDSLKIEGRLKPPEYVYNTVRLYRYIIDNPTFEDEEEYGTLRANSEFVFSREKTNGYLFGGNKEKVITSLYSRSVGHSIGRVEKVSGLSFSFTSGSAITTDDVLQFFLNESERLPFKLPVRRIYVDGASVINACKGARVTIESDKVPEPGQEVFKVYAKGLELTGVRHKYFEPFKRVLLIDVTFEWKEHGMMRIDIHREEGIVTYTHPCVFDKGNVHTHIAELMSKIFSTPNDSMYEIRIGEIRNETALELVDIGVQNRLLAKIREGLLDFAAGLDDQIDAKLLSSIKKQKNNVRIPRAIPGIRGISEFISNRENLSPRVSAIPFYTGGDIDSSTIAFYESACFLPLKPVVNDDEVAYYEDISAFISSNPHLVIYLGVNNLHHFKVVEGLAGNPNVYSFIDFFFYIGNGFALDFVLKALDNVAFGYFWIEGNEADYNLLRDSIDFSLMKIGPSFAPPYFFHTGSFTKESLDFDVCMGSENKKYMLQYKEYKFEVTERFGASYVFLRN